MTIGIPNIVVLPFNAASPFNRGNEYEPRIRIRRGKDGHVHYSESSVLVYFNGRSSSLRSASNLRLAFGRTLLGRPNCDVEKELFSRCIFVASFDNSDTRRVKWIHYIGQWWPLTFFISSVRFGPRLCGSLRILDNRQ